MTQIITIREFLRGAKHWKKQLVSRKIDMLTIPIREGGEIELTYKSEKTPFERLMEKIKKNPIKGLKRPKEDLFDERS